MQTALLAPLPFLPHIALESGLTPHAGEILPRAGLTGAPLLVADTNTWNAAGAALTQTLHADALVLEGAVLPAIETARQVNGRAQNAPYILAVGSGTLNDICKYAAHLSQKPYAVFATAPSMNGYASANASLLAHGHKQSFTATLPRAILADTDVLSRAPIRLIRAGLGDSLARPTAQWDWRMAHHVFGVPYDERPFTLLERAEEEMLSRAAGLASRDPTAVAALANVLILSGLGMTLAGGSQPASQGEHMLAHTFEMLHPAAAHHSLHGEQIAVTALTAARAQEKLMMRSLALAPLPDTVPDGFGPELAESLIPAYLRKKALLGPYVTSEFLHADWPDVAAMLRSISIPARRMKAALEACGAPTDAAALGCNAADYAQAQTLARFTRERITYLDLIP